ncbi:MAG: VIT1/CCC1 transporter family protein [SAR202 cluster bacterium]|nr:VIT1/CCC1 transporter family protein [SAR202 cluster bacterium]
MAHLPDEHLAELVANHTKEAVQARLAAGPSASYLRDFIFGAIDGTVTTFAVVSSVSGAGLAASVLIILGVANLVADGFSMGIGNFLGSRAEQQQRRSTRLEEEHHVRNVPEGEKEEIRQIFANKGFAGDDLERVVEVITSDQDRWVAVMLQEEHGFPAIEVPPSRAGLATYLGFMVAGLMPLLPFIYQAYAPGDLPQPFFWSIAVAGLVFFTIGGLKSFFVEQVWYWAGLEVLAIGGVAAGLAYLVGALLKGVADSV